MIAVKRILILFEIISLVGFSCKKDNSTNDCNINRFYYYQGGKIFLKEVFNKGTISFYDTLSIDTINKILKPYEKIRLITNPTRANYIIISIDCKNCLETKLLFNEIKKDRRISNCNEFLSADEGNGAGIYDIFLCKLKNDTLKNHLNELLVKTKTQIVKNSISGYYLIRADKNSKGDAMDISNEFYESGYFEWSEPNFINSFSPI